MRRPLVAGNWKMYGSKTMISGLMSALKGSLAQLNTVDIAVCPPFVYLDYVRQLMEGTPLCLGAQNVSSQAKQGAFTGEISADMLKDLQCHYIIVGHSERRSLYGENNETVAEKFKITQDVGLKPIFCVGESLEQREQGITAQVVAAQIDAVFSRCGVAALAQAVIAYEPVWAIGTGKTASPAQAQEVHQFIRQKIAKVNPDIAQGLCILYGGSVKGDNARELFSMPDIDGGLIGGASLKAEEFIQIALSAGISA